jgi:uroporphyrin-III C-methyltransferase
MRRMSGKVYIIGAGPGDPDLLTLKAVRALERADVVLYDRLVTAEVLKLCPPKATLIYVGKSHGEQRFQDRINSTLLNLAKENKVVVRLKGGDPFVFGRGGEEWAFLNAHGIAVEVVPGLSSALSLPSLAGIPLTYRGISASFAVIAGHRQEGAELNLAAVARVETLIILMGVNERRKIAQRLIEHGRPPDEPVAFIENGARPAERVITSELVSVAEGRVEVHPPAVWIIGKVVNLRRCLAPWGDSSLDEHSGSSLHLAMK